MRAAGKSAAYLNFYLTEDERLMAVRLWSDGLDTFDIAAKIGVHEAAVYNGLREHRERIVRMRAIAKRMAG